MQFARAESCLCTLDERSAEHFFGSLRAAAAEFQQWSPHPGIHW
jgi:hypothetical protein